MPTGTATVNFGSFPGSSHASVAVTGQASIVAGSLVEAWIRPVATTDHSADEHMIEALRVFAADIVAGMGFTIHAFNDNRQSEPLESPGRDRMHRAFQTVIGNNTSAPHPRSVGGKLPMVYGQYEVAWAWN